MKYVEIEKVVILMRFIQFGWTEEHRKQFDGDLRHMLEIQSVDIQNVVSQIEELRDRYDSNDFAIRGVLEKVLEIINDSLGCEE